MEKPSAFIYFITFEHVFESENCVVSLWLPGGLSGFTRKMHPPSSSSDGAGCAANTRSSARPGFASQSSSCALRKGTLKPGDQTTVYHLHPPTPTNPGQRALNMLGSTNPGTATATEDWFSHWKLLQPEPLPPSPHPQIKGDPESFHMLLKWLWARRLVRTRHTRSTVS